MSALEIGFLMLVGALSLWIAFDAWSSMLRGRRSCGERLVGFPDSVCRRPRGHPGSHFFELERSL